MATGSPLILVADDEELVRELAVRALQQDGYRVLKTSDGLETLKVLRRNAPDLVLLDIGMPGLDGKAVARIVRSMGDKAPVIVFLTADSGGREEGMEIGAADYIVKPFGRRDLTARVGAALAARGRVDAGDVVA